MANLGEQLATEKGTANTAKEAEQARLHLPCTSPISRLYLAYISPISRLHLAYISPISRLYLTLRLLAPGMVAKSSYEA